MLATQGQRWIEKWTAEGKMAVLERQLTRRFGPLPADVEARIQAADNAALDDWCDRILEARTIDEVFGGGSGAG